MSTFGSGDPAVLPEPGMVRLSETVAWQPDGPYPITIWHWCDHRLWAGRDHYDAHRDEYVRWQPASASAHAIISTDPLHLEPSVYWPDCCGMHGFIRAGVWTDA